MGFFWYDNDKDLKVCFLLTRVILLYFREAVEFLSSEGHIYSTIDDEHYKSTDSGD